MIASNIFRMIGSLFTDFLFVPFEYLRLVTAKAVGGWWTSNAINWVFMVILIILLSYWMGQAFKFKREGTEDRA